MKRKKFISFRCSLLSIKKNELFCILFNLLKYKVALPSASINFLFVSDLGNSILLQKVLEHYTGLKRILNSIAKQLGLTQYNLELNSLNDKQRR